MPRSSLFSALRFVWTFGLAVLALSCAESAALRVSAPPSTPPVELVELVESAPLETTLDHPDIPNASRVWLEMIGQARRRLDFAEFYVSTAPQSLLEPILGAIEAAADRGVRVRFLVDDKFAEKYPEPLARLGGHKGITLRRVGFGEGVLHAKYFIVDGEEAYLGSQNFDWRSLSHIQEIGVRVRARAVAVELGAIFEADWAMAGGEPKELVFGKRAQVSGTVEGRYEGASIRLELGASPRGSLPNASSWDLPRLIGEIDKARQEIEVQLLTYKTISRDGSPFTELDEALRRAASRGVRVRLLVSNWNTKEGAIEAIQSLARTSGIEVKIMSIPEWSGGFVPFARVSHAKYMVVDGVRSWVGTSNWEGDYFYKSRNVGLFIESERFASKLGRVFEDGWNSSYAARVDPDASYTPPRVQ